MPRGASSTTRAVPETTSIATRFSRFSPWAYSSCEELFHAIAPGDTPETPTGRPRSSGPSGASGSGSENDTPQPLATNWSNRIETRLNTRARSICGFTLGIYVSRKGSIKLASGVRCAIRRMTYS